MEAIASHIRRTLDSTRITREYFELVRVAKAATTNEEESSLPILNGYNYFLVSIPANQFMHCRYLLCQFNATILINSVALKKWSNIVMKSLRTCFRQGKLLP